MQVIPIQELKSSKYDLLKNKIFFNLNPNIIFEPFIRETCDEMKLYKPLINKVLSYKQFFDIFSEFENLPHIQRFDLELKMLNIINTYSKKDIIWGKILKDQNASNNNALAFYINTDIRFKFFKLSNAQLYEMWNIVYDYGERFYSPVMIALTERNALLEKRKKSLPPRLLKSEKLFDPEIFDQFMIEDMLLLIKKSAVRGNTLAFHLLGHYYKYDYPDTDKFCETFLNLITKGFGPISFGCFDNHVKSFDFYVNTILQFIVCSNSGARILRFSYDIYCNTESLINSKILERFNTVYNLNKNTFYPKIEKYELHEKLLVQVVRCITFKFGVSSKILKPYLLRNDMVTGLILYQFAIQSFIKENKRHFMIRSGKLGYQPAILNLEQRKDLSVLPIKWREHPVTVSAFLIDQNVKIIITF